jgi:hypothetical protein
MVQNELLLLISEIKESTVVLNKLNQLYTSYQSAFREETTRDLRDAVLLSDILCNTYTCIETILFRIARVFENHLDPERWYKELLRKMHLEIPGIRKAVLSSESYALLDELRRFRHFKRYYYDFDYDWAKLDYLRGIYDRLTPLIHLDLETFTNFLFECSDSLDA